MIDSVDPLGDLHGQRVPAAVVGIVVGQVVLAVLAGAVAIFDNVLGVVADDDGEIAVLLHPLFGDRVDGLSAAVVVDRENRGDNRRPQLTGLGERRSPVVDLAHSRPIRTPP